MAADELRCSVMAVADADPEWRLWATLKIVAEAQAAERKKGSTAK